MAKKPVVRKPWFVGGAQERRNLVRDKRVRYRDTVRATRKKAQEVKKTKRKQLKEVTAECNVERDEARKAITKSCDTRRRRVRSKAQEQLDKLAAKRQERRDSWLYYATGHGAPRKPRGFVKYSKAESDQMALKSIPDQYGELWWKHRQAYDYGISPDMRAEAFMEWVQSDEGQNAYVLWAESQVPSDDEFARQYAAREAKQGRGPGIVGGKEDFGAFLDDLDEAAPF